MFPQFSETSVRMMSGVCVNRLISTQFFDCSVFTDSDWCLLLTKCFHCFHKLKFPVWSDWKTFFKYFVMLSEMVLTDLSQFCQRFHSMFVKWHHQTRSSPLFPQVDVNMYIIVSHVTHWYEHIKNVIFVTFLFNWSVFLQNSSFF